MQIQRAKYNSELNEEPADDWGQHYNEFRPHESVGDFTSMEFIPRKCVKEDSSFQLSIC